MPSFITHIVITTFPLRKKRRNIIKINMIKEHKTHTDTQNEKRKIKQKKNEREKKLMIFILYQMKW